LKLVLTSALFGALFLVSGCGTQCESISRQYNACPIGKRFIQIDTENFCGQVDAFNARAAAAGQQCTPLWTAHLACWQQHISSICDTNFADCDDSAIAWQDCVRTYCEAVPADKYEPECQGGEFLDDPLSLPSPFQSGF